MNEIPRSTSDTWATAGAGLAYLRRGWSVIPIRPRDKRPLISWRAYQTQRAAPVELLDWLRRWPDANLAIVTGAVSGLVVLDLDAAHGGLESWQALERSHGPTEAALSAFSGGGGRHFYFAHPGNRVQNRAGLAPGVDLRGDGGYIVAPPSRHASGAYYRWEACPESRAPGPMPEWLLPKPPTAGGRSPAEWRRLAKEGVGQGRRNDTVASLAGHLLGRGVDAWVTLELLLGWNATRCRPPMPAAEVASTVASIRSADERRRAKPRPVEEPQIDLLEGPGRYVPAAAGAMEHR